MPQPHPGSSPAPIPDRAVRQATEDLYDVHDPEAIAQRAREIARQAQERRDERHDEYDDLIRAARPDSRFTQGRLLSPLWLPQQEAVRPMRDRPLASTTSPHEG